MAAFTWRRTGAFLVLLGCLAGSARAGMFDDDEARKAILDLRSQLADQQQQNTAAQKQLADQVQQLQRSLLDLNNQNEQLRSDLARLRGQDEQMLRDLADVQRKQQDIAQGVDDRIRKLEPQKVSLDGRDFTVEPDEKLAYDSAIAALRSGDFEHAASGLVAFLSRYPASGYADSARYWLGNAQYGERAYRDAIASFKAFIGAAPGHPRAPEALLALANCQIELKDTRSAKRSLGELLKTYPKSEAAQAARERLAALK